MASHSFILVGASGKLMHNQCFHVRVPLYTHIVYSLYTLHLKCFKYLNLISDTVHGFEYLVIFNVCKFVNLL